ncbi:hypothetical protein ACF0H5_002940 [Mactra antiquata]
MDWQFRLRTLRGRSVCNLDALVVGPVGETKMVQMVLYVAACPGGWIMHGFHASIHQDMLRIEKMTLCQANLAIIDSADENKFLADYLHSRLDLAGTDHDNEGQWMWKIGNNLQNIQYQNWHSGEPDHGMVTRD